MSGFTGSGDSGATANSKPCLGCRQRKVKCDKTRPCSNCARSEQLCTYETTGASNTFATTPQTVGNVHERLAKLEALMATLLVRDGIPNAPSTLQSVVAHDDDSTGRIIPTVSTSLPPVKLDIRDHTETTRKTNAPVGQILFQDGHSSYFDADFWGGLITEVGQECLLYTCIDITSRLRI